jgi:hypothetical protein
MRCATHSHQFALTTFTEFVSHGFDISTLTDELIHYATHKGAFLYNTEVFNPSHVTPHQDAGATLGDTLRLQVKDRATSLKKSDQSMRDLLTQYASLLSARENVKLQSSVGKLTWVLVGLTIVIAVLTIPMTYSAIGGAKGIAALLQYLHTLFAGSG